MNSLQRWRRTTGLWWLGGTLAVFWGSLGVAQHLSDQKFTSVVRHWQLSADDLKGVKTLRVTQKSSAYVPPLNLEFNAGDVLQINANGLLNDFEQTMPLKVVRMGDVLAVHVDVDDQNERSWKHRFELKSIQLPRSIERVEGVDLMVQVNRDLPHLTVGACDSRVYGSGSVSRLSVLDWADCSGLRSNSSSSTSVSLEVKQQLQVTSQAGTVELMEAAMLAQQINLKLRANQTRLTLENLKPWMNSQQPGSAKGWSLTELQPTDVGPFPSNTAQHWGPQAVELRPQWRMLNGVDQGEEWEGHRDR